MAEPETAAPGLESGGILHHLGLALATWTSRADPGPVTRWLDRELDADGIPRRLAVESWWPAIELFAAGMPDEAVDRVGGFLLAALRFSASNFDPVLGAVRPDPRIIRKLAATLGDPGVKTVVSWWSTTTRRATGHAPPLPAFATEPQVLAMLRADWSETGDLLAIDHRDRGLACRMALLARGRRVLGPNWSTHGATGPARLVRWATGMHADLLEWTFRVGSSRITRMAVLLRGRRLALLADQVVGPIDSLTIDLAPGSESVPIVGSRGLRLKNGGQTLARVLPIGLPSAPYPTERGSLATEDGSLVLRQRPEAAKSWLPLLFSWDSDRDRRPATWRRLTVAQNSRNCPPGVAFAARIGWGIGEEGIVVYRSLGRPALRSFLGHQTTARFVIGAFSETGNVSPLVSLD
jgi:hypothetical protein